MKSSFKLSIIAMSAALVALADCDPSLAKNKSLTPKSLTQVQQELGPVFKQVNPFAGLKEILDGQIDGGSASVTQVNISATISILPNAVTVEITPDVALPLSAWKASLSTATSYFPTVTGQTPNDDNLICKTLSLVNSGPKVRITCPYKTKAHALNIASSLAMISGVGISHYANGTNYTGQGLFASSCTRATKTTPTFTCN
jgi:hypothetical protein